MRRKFPPNLGQVALTVVAGEFREGKMRANAPEGRE